PASPKAAPHSPTWSFRARQYTAGTKKPHGAVCALVLSGVLIPVPDFAGTDQKYNFWSVGSSFVNQATWGMVISKGRNSSFSEKSIR
ncbi:MAG TPA: hypothetical protein PLN94_19585, partial [Thiolinea sp.]|nr:hypothetical protein [Thiolinea sp.]